MTSFVAVVAVGGAVAGARAAAGPDPAAVAGPPVTAPVDAFSAAVVAGAPQNDFYLFLSRHAGQVVRLSVQARSPGQVVAAGNPRRFGLSTGCAGTSPPPNCARMVSMTATTYVLRDVGPATGATTGYANGVFTVTGHFAVGQPTRDAGGVVTVPLRALAPGGPWMTEDDE
ncbi:MAG TPA: hypothetical protein VI357_21765 [Mycobacteriales bacterium]